MNFKHATNIIVSLLILLAVGDRVNAMSVIPEPTSFDGVTVRYENLEVDVPDEAKTQVVTSVKWLRTHTSDQKICATLSGRECTPRSSRNGDPSTVGKNGCGFSLPFKHRRDDNFQHSR